jgi:hypothetical protein
MGLFRAVGSFGRRIWDTIKSVAEPIRAAFDVARQIGAEVEPAAILTEYRTVVRLEGIAEQLAQVGRDEYIPPDLYQESLIPWKTPYAYEVTASGRNIKGKFARESRMMCFSRQMTIGELEDEYVNRFGIEGGSPQMIEITHLSVTGAEYRAGEEYRLW